jgi:hypothetical protein
MKIMFKTTIIRMSLSSEFILSIFENKEKG